MPIFHFPRLRSASWIRTTSPSLTFISLGLCSMLCLSLRDFRYSPLHRFHRTSLHRRRYFTLFLKSASPSSVFFSGTSLGWPNIMSHGVKTSSCTSSSTYDRGWLFSAISKSSKTSAGSFRIRLARPILLCNARFTTPKILFKCPLPPPPTRGLCLDEIATPFNHFAAVTNVRLLSDEIFLGRPFLASLMNFKLLQQFGFVATQGGQLWLSWEQITKCMLFLLFFGLSLYPIGPGKTRQTTSKGADPFVLSLAISQLVSLRKR